MSKIDEEWGLKSTIKELKARSTSDIMQEIGRALEIMLKRIEELERKAGI